MIIMQDRVYNFSAGPSQLPLPVLEQAQKELLSYPGAGTSVLEMSHRSKAFDDIINGAHDRLKALMNVPDDYEILFLQGGATLQFSMVAMNLAMQGDTMAFIKSGQFSSKAMQEGARWGNAVCAASSEDRNYAYIPKVDPGKFPRNARFLHFTGNNTVFGTAFWELPVIPQAGSRQTGAAQSGKASRTRLVGDWSSSILGMQIDVSKHDLIYAGAQKNIGPAGVTVVILKKEILDQPVDPVLPIMMRYKVAADARSMYNTPPCFAIYVSGLVFKWVEEQGGVAEMERRNREKAALLYDLIDGSDFYTGLADKADRSIMNVTFKLPSQELTADFLKLCESRGMINLKGYRAVGGCRASIYNGMPLEGVQKLAQTMKDFELANK